MHHRRPPTDRDRDGRALTKIELLIDSIVEGKILCPKCKVEHKADDLTPSQARLLSARYDKLRPTLSAVEHSGQVETWSKLLKSIEAPQQLDQEAQSSHTPVVTH